ncbi:hypothetical protein NMG60_11015612 [Bertholletia excelsa]
MSGRGRGRGSRGGGRGQPTQRYQPSPAQAAGRGRGAQRGAPQAAAPPPQAGIPSRPPHSPVASIPSTSRPPSSPSPPQSAESLVGAVERTLVLQSPTSSVQAPATAASPPPESSKALCVPARPGYGTVGRKCVVRANHFLVGIANKDIHHYDVTITPEVSSKRVSRDIIKELVSLYRESHLGKRWPAYDGRKSLYTAGPFPFSSKEFDVRLDGRDDSRRGERRFKVAIKFAAKVDIYHLEQFLRSGQRDVPQETIQVLDVVLRSAPSTNYTVVGRSFFSPSLGQRGELGDGLEYWKGFYQSLRPTQMGLSLNIDMSARAFYEPILVHEFVHKYFNKDLGRSLSDQERIKIKRALKGVKVELIHREGVRYKISGVSAEPINRLTFVDDTGANVLVADYFHQKYNIRLRNASLPALLAGSDARPIYLPMEQCKIVEGQRYAKKLNDRQVTALLRATCQRPMEREASVKQMVRHNNYNSDELVKEFGLNVNAELTNVDARVLPTPMLQYHNSRETPRVGAWNMIEKKMVNGGRVDFWTCVSFSRTRQDVVNRFCQDLVSMCSFQSGSTYSLSFCWSGQIERTLQDIHRQSVDRLAKLGFTGKQLQLLIVVLPDVSGSYGKIKRVCETELGIVSQCCQPRHVTRGNKQYLENVSLKINVKVGGRNTVLLDALERRLPIVSERPTIIFGADVTHPPPGEDSSPSIAAVVASMDWPEITKFRGLVSSQSHRDEIIHDLYTRTEDPHRGVVHGGMIRELFIAFRRSTGLKPDRIIFYRDGVSEGQFNQVLLHEMDAIRRACVSLEENYLPPVTFVVVQKRHHTRLFPSNHHDRNLTDRSGNILPGTVVDRTICHPTEFDFYLCSHSGIQGTSRPTHYHVLYDENNFTADKMQVLTNSLCYTYFFCPLTMPPAYYAHLAAFRARYYMEGEISDGGSTSAGRPTRETSTEARPLPAIKENVKDVMFYC